MIVLFFVLFRDKLRNSNSNSDSDNSTSHEMISGSSSITQQATGPQSRTGSRCCRAECAPARGGSGGGGG